MNHDDLEKDPLWDLLRESPAHRPGTRFATDVVRAARIATPAKPWWAKVLILFAAGGALAGAAALVVVALSFKSDAPSGGEVAVILPPAGESLADIQDGVETEMLLAAADYLSDYSDDELVSLIGF